MKYLVTGGLGFIGSKLVNELVKNNEVVVIDNDVLKSLKTENIKNSKSSNFKFYECDILNEKVLDDIFKMENFDFIIHLAAKAGVRTSFENPVLYEKVNCVGTINILEMAKKYNIKKVILISSSSVYGNCKEVPFKETTTNLEPISPYALTKKQNEEIARLYHKVYGLDIILPRLFTVYGPNQREDLAIAKFTRLIDSGEEIPMYGSGFTKRDYTYIDDIVNGLIQCSDYLNNNTNVYEVINLGSSHPIYLRDMIHEIGVCLNKEVKIKELPLYQGDVNQTYASIEKAFNLIGYQPKQEFNEGIKKYVLWYKQNNH